MKIVLIGTGNVALHLGSALLKAGHEILQLVGRTESKTKALSKKFNCNYVIGATDINTNAAAYIIALKDDAISSFAKKLSLKNKIIIHTSGSVNSQVLACASINYGVLYPLQTFSSNRKINFSGVPLCLEGNSTAAKKTIHNLATSLSKNVNWVNLEQRQVLHLAAVVANNFSNHLFTLSAELLKTNGLSFDLLRPLIAETASKIQNNNPVDMQTGPAKRGDSRTINQHLGLLKKKTHLHKIYDVITQSIEDHDGPRL